MTRPRSRIIIGRTASHGTRDAEARGLVSVTKQTTI